jgi:hypothetical protein
MRTPVAIVRAFTRIAGPLVLALFVFLVAADPTPRCLGIDPDAIPESPASAPADYVLPVAVAAGLTVIVAAPRAEDRPTRRVHRRAERALAHSAPARVAPTRHALLAPPLRL